MEITLTSPAPPHIWSGNRVTAQRWAKVLTDLGHSVRTQQTYTGEACDLLIALHAGKSASSIERFSKQHPNHPIIVAITGTDVYGDLQTNPEVLISLELATRIVSLQPTAAEQLPQRLRERVRVIYQSVSPPGNLPTKRDDVFDICVIGNLRDVKDPFRTAHAVKLLPETSRIRVVHVGAALTEDMAKQAKSETDSNARYTWLGPLPRRQAMRTLAESRLMVLTSKTEGGANVVSEAIVYGVPIISSRISGSIGLLGQDYPGYFPVGDTPSLAALLHRAETNSDFLETLTTRAIQLAPLFNPSNERTAWQNLLNEL